MTPSAHTHPASPAITADSHAHAAHAPHTPHPPLYTSPRAGYQQLLSSGVLQPDAAQQSVAEALERLFHSLQPALQPGLGHRLRRLLRGVSGPSTHGAKNNAQGMYIFGDVGRGKTMLMDIFYHALPGKRKQRRHFHSFMQRVHADIHAIRQQGLHTEINPVDQVADALAERLRVLCLDEMQVHDVADAMILSRLFTRLLDHGVTVLFTSNRRPEALYQGGLQRELFEKFIALIRERLDIVELAAKEDYRLQALRAMRHVYHHPLGADASAFLDEATHRLMQAKGLSSVILEVQGRQWRLSTLGGSVAVSHFAELCEKPLGAADYLALARRFHTVIVSDIPILTPEKRNEAKRFVTLIDALYDHKTKLICTAAAATEKLYPEGDGSFEFARTVSRLIEMQSERYLAMPHETGESGEEWKK